ncbi:MAG: hypothetical protein AAGG48_16680 [Planctomycetota bacterium]
MVNPFEPPTETSRIKRVKDRCKVTIGQFAVMGCVASFTITVALAAVSGILAIAIKFLAN